MLRCFPIQNSMTQYWKQDLSPLYIDNEACCDKYVNDVKRNILYPTGRLIKTDLIFHNS